jgi:Caudovirales tail fibre assembly protein, lambda gpK
MNETWTKRDQARVEFLDAAVELFRTQEHALDFGVATPEQKKAYAAWSKYRELLDGKEENTALDPDRWFCPYCGAQRPKYYFQFIGEALLGIGTLQYFNAVCGNESCRKLLGVIGAGFMAEAQMIALAKEQMRQKKAGIA